MRQSISYVLSSKMWLRPSIFCTILVAAVAIVHKIPPYIKICSRNDPDINACLLKSFDSLGPYLAKGIPELQIPAVDPLSLPLVTLDANNFHASLKDAMIHNASLYQAKSANFDFDSLSLEFVLFFPRLKIVGEYELRGKILILELKGTGDAIADIDDLTATVQMKAEQVTRNKKVHYRIKENLLDLNVGKIKFRFDNLFGTNQQLTEATNKVINENWKDFYDELLPLIKDVIGAFVFPVASRVFDSFPVDELFPITK